MKHPSTPLAAAALAAFLLPVLAYCAVPTEAIPADPLVNVQCEGTTSNAGSLALGGRNSVLNGLIVDGYFSDGIIQDSDTGYSDAFKTAWNPAGTFVDLDYCLYIAPDTFMEAMRSAGRSDENAFSLPEWTVVTRVMVPEDGDDGTAGDENTWTAELEETLIDIYQSENLIGGEAEGYTQGKEKVLSASDISEAMLCFRNVAALATHGEGTPATRAAAEHADDYAAVADLIVAYEFGISRVTLEQDESGDEVALVEVTLRNELATHFADRVDHIKDPAEFTDVDTTENIETATPDYAEGTTLVFAVNGQDVAADTVTEETAATRADGTSLTRRFRVPLAGIPADDAGRLALSVRALTPAQASAAE